MILDIENVCSDEQVDEPTERLLTMVADAALRETGFDSSVCVSCVLCSDAYIRSLNRQYRGKDAATDVLSFPMLEYDCPLKPVSADFELAGGEGLLLGDIVISLERMAAQAKEYAHSKERELAFLMAHGMLHLLGFDHEDEAEAAEMFALQDEILTGLKITRD